MELFSTLLMDATKTARSILFEVLPIAVVIFGSQLLVIRKRVANQHKIAIGFVYVVIGLTLFLVGLDKALFPIGKTMATQLTAPGFLGGGEKMLSWRDYYWVYILSVIKTIGTPEPV